MFWLMTVKAPLLGRGVVMNVGKGSVCGKERSAAGVSVYK